MYSSGVYNQEEGRVTGTEGKMVSGMMSFSTDLYESGGPQEFESEWIP